MCASAARSSANGRRSRRHRRDSERLNHDDRDVRRKPRQKSAHVVWAQRNAAQGGSKAGFGAVQEDRAAAARPTGRVIVVENEDHVVEPVCTPHHLVSRAHGQGMRPIVRGRSRIVAPPEVARQATQGHTAGWALRPVGTKIAEHHRKSAGRRRTIALALGLRDAVSPQRAGQGHGTGLDMPARTVFTRQPDRASNRQRLQAADGNPFTHIVQVPTLWRLRGIDELTTVPRRSCFLPVATRETRGS